MPPPPLPSPGCLTLALTPSNQHWQVVDLAQEVIAHIRQAAGPDALLQAFNQAMSAVKSARAERKRQQAVQVLGWLSPPPP